MRRFFKKYKPTIIVAVTVIVVIVSLVFMLGSTSHNQSDISVSYLGDGQIVVNNELPMTDAVGKVISLENTKVGTTGYLEFEVKSSVEGKVKYEVYLNKSTLANEVPVKFVKVYLTDENDTALKYFDVASVPTYYDLRVSDTDPSGKLLYSGTLKNKSNKKFKLRMWVADTYELTSDVRMFSVKLNVKVK